ncbi:hypothetical protein P5673_023771 [Acropora cervicornis]|uniref:Uncharacterized protein n=1 Tax=Acropora cervicornis TaxID=6130 RepID=A0AAD9Q5P8_ACRCE|nr:hypothetical protein P5673_023771 [Acropora cervicornis]
MLNNDFNQGKLFGVFCNGDNSQLLTRVLTAMKNNDDLSLQVNNKTKPEESTFPWTVKKY